MKKLERLSMVAAMLLFSAMMTFAQQKPNIHILATGGTIAGTGTSATATNYTAGQVAIGTLLDAVPELKNIANVTGEQTPFPLDSFAPATTTALYKLRGPSALRAVDGRMAPTKTTGLSLFTVRLRK